MDDVTPKKALPFMLHSVTIFFPTILSVPVTLLITKFFSVTAILIILIIQIKGLVKYVRNLAF